MAAIDDLTISGGSATSGGGIDNDGNLTISDSVISNNMATGDGGGIENEGGDSLTISDSAISGNTAGGSGGGIDNQGVLSIIDSTIAGNSTGTDGSGGGIDDTGLLTVSGSTIEDNTAGLAGGGIFNGSGTATVVNSTIGDNSAGYFGGGILVGASLTAVNTTIAYNTITVYSSSGGGLDVAGPSTATLYNTIVAKNTDPSGADDIAGTVTPDSADNLIGTGGSGGLTSGTSNGNQVGIASPGLDPNGPQPNGGPTPTIALLAGSPAIDAGSNSWANSYGVTTDQRGALRGGQPDSLNAGSTVDIGAYEASSSYLVTTTADTTAIGTLRSAILWADSSTNADPANLASPRPTRSTSTFRRLIRATPRSPRLFKTV